MAKENYVSIPVGDNLSMDAYVAKPAGSGPWPAVIVLQEAFGVNNNMRNVTNRLAAEGFYAIAPELFHRTGTGVESEEYNFDAMATHFKAITNDGIEADVTAAYNWLQQQPNILKDNIGCMGFCLGGRAVFIANAALPLQAAVSFYGGYTHTLAHRAAQLHAPHLFFWGGLDKHILPEHIMPVTDALTAANKPYTNVVISTADHAFFNNDRVAYNAEAAAEAWAHTLTFLKNKLR